MGSYSCARCKEENKFLFLESCKPSCLLFAFLAGTMVNFDSVLEMLSSLGKDNYKCKLFVSLNFN